MGLSVHLCGADMEAEELSYVAKLAEGRVSGSLWPHLFSDCEWMIHVLHCCGRGEAGMAGRSSH